MFLTSLAMLIGATLLLYDKDLAGWATIFIPLLYQAYNHQKLKISDKKSKQNHLNMLIC